MSEAVFRCLLNPMITVFGEPKTDDVAAFLNEYAETLAHFDEDDLMEAKRHIMRTHKVRVWPTPAELLKGCNEAMKRNAPTFKTRTRAAIRDCTTAEQVRAIWAERVVPRRGFYETVADLEGYAERRCHQLDGSALDANVIDIAARIIGEGA